MNDSTIGSDPTAVRSDSYKYWALTVLLLVAILNYVDRIVLTVLQEPMKHELHLSDWQLGLLSGPAFALFYSFSGIPVARLAERFNRAHLLAAATAFWSIATALCGAAGSFVQLALCRVGVGMGEGGCIPASHSLISDYFRAKQRGLIMSVVSAAPSIAGVITPPLAAYLALTHGWRTAFVAIGLPGVLVALLAYFTLRDPRNSVANRDSGTTAAPARRSLWVDGRWLFGNRAFVYVFFAGACIGMGNAGIVAFYVSFLVRTIGMDLPSASHIYSLAALAGFIASFVGGWCADRFADARGRSYVLVPALGAFGCFAGFLIAYLQTSATLVTVMLLFAAFCYNLKNGPMFAAVQNIAPAHMRATAAALYMVAATALGTGLGPILTGGISDFVANGSFALEGGFGAMCPGGRAAAGSAQALISACQAASAEGLQTALVATSFVFLFAGILLLLSSRSIQMAEKAG